MSFPTMLSASIPTQIFKSGYLKLRPSESRLQIQKLETVTRGSLLSLVQQLRELTP
jgi:hypothetical protein